MIKVREIKQTSGFSPSQWEGLTNRGNYLYIRERNNYLNCDISTSYDAWESGRYRVILEKESVGTYGCMDKREMIELTKGVLDFTGCEFI